MFNELKKSVGAKIALTTAVALVLVSALLLGIFHFVNFDLYSRLTPLQLIALLAGLMILVEVLAVILASHFFIRRPMGKLTEVMKIAESGNFLMRLKSQSPDELGLMARLFNGIMTRITHLDASKIEAERELILIRQNLEYKTALEEKAKIIRQTNRQLENSLQDLSVLYEISQRLSQPLEINELFMEIKRIFLGILHLDKFCLLFLEDNSPFLHRLVDNGFKGNSKLTSLRFRADCGFLGKVLLEKRICEVGDIKEEKLELPSLLDPGTAGSLLGIPLKALDRVAGIMLVFNEDKQAFSASTQKLLESVASQVVLAYDRSQFYMRTKSLSVTDELTGLSNRRHFQEVLYMEWKRAQRFKRPLSLLILDVDYFKNYNDRFGHLQGDQALKELSRVLEEHIREVDTAARFGGEEFVVVLPDTDLNSAMKVGEKLRVLVEEKGHLFAEREKQAHALTVSVGVSAFPEKASSAEDLINKADMALYQAKALGRNRVIGYEEPLEITAQNKEKSPFGLQRPPVRVIPGGKKED